MEIAITVALAVIELFITLAITDQQNKDADRRNAHATRVQHIFDAVKDRFNLSYNQLDQLMSNLDLRLNQLAEATRGSARLSKASRILREYINEYPQSRNAINRAKNQITNSINNLSAEETSAISRIQGRGNYTDLEALEKISPEIRNINTELTEVNNRNNQNNNNSDMQIELSDKEILPEEKKTSSGSTRSYPTPRLPIPGTV